MLMSGALRPSAGECPGRAGAGERLTSELLPACEAAGPPCAGSLTPGPAPPSPSAASQPQWNGRWPAAGSGQERGPPTPVLPGTSAPQPHARGDGGVGLGLGCCCTGGARGQGQPAPAPGGPSRPSATQQSIARVTES